MFIDLVFFILMIMAIFKGMSKGFIVAVFSLLAFIIGLAAALKLSAAVAVHLHEKMNVSGYWLPFLSFLIVFIAVVFIIRWGAALVKKAAGIVFLGWIDTLAGILLYVFMYLMIYSVILFFCHTHSFDFTKCAGCFAYVFFYRAFRSNSYEWFG